ncbi:SH3 domain-containing protein [Kurthia sp. Dielmo]
MNLRTKASTKGKVVTQIKRGTQLDIISVNRSETWAKVKYYKNGKNMLDM